MLYYAMQQLWGIHQMDQDAKEAGWLSEFQMQHQFTNPGQLKAMSMRMSEQHSTYLQLTTHLEKELGNIYDKDTVEEWMAEQIYEPIHKIKATQEKIRSLLQQAHWDKRPLQKILTGSDLTKKLLGDKGSAIAGANKVKKNGTRGITPQSVDKGQPLVVIQSDQKAGVHSLPSRGAETKMNSGEFQNQGQAGVNSSSKVIHAVHRSKDLWNSGMLNRKGVRNGSVHSQTPMFKRMGKVNVTNVGKHFVEKQPPYILSDSRKPSVNGAQFNRNENNGNNQYNNNNGLRNLGKSNPESQPRPKASNHNQRLALRQGGLLGGMSVDDRVLGDGERPVGKGGAKTGDRHFAVDPQMREKQVVDMLNGDGGNDEPVADVNDNNKNKLKSHIADNGNGEKESKDALQDSGLSAKFIEALRRSHNTNDSHNSKINHKMFPNLDTYHQ